jgi:hypothetical protein
MDEGNAELGADESEVLRAVGGGVVDVESFGDPAAQDGLLENGQEGSSVLGESEGGEGNEAGGVIEQGDQVSLAFALVLDKDGGPVHHVTHPELAFLDDRTALVLTAEQESVVLKTLALAPSVPAWEVRLPALVDHRLSLDRQGGRWQVSGLSPDRSQVVRLSGALQGSSIEEARWETGTRVGPLDWFVHSGERILRLEWDSEDMGSYGRSAWLPLPLRVLFGHRLRRNLVSVGKGGDTVTVARTALEVSCLPPRIHDKVFYCTAGDGERSELWSVDLAGPTLTPLGSLPAPFGLYRENTSPSSGNLLVMSNWPATHWIVDLNRWRSFEEN